MNQTFTQVEKIEIFSGKAILAGTILTLAITTTMNLLGLGIGFIALSYLGNGTSLGTVGVFWLALTAAIATFIGGWVAGFLTERISNDNIQGIVHGSLVWALTILITFSIITTGVGTIVSGSSGLLKNIITAAQPKVKIDTQISQESFSELKDSLQNKLQGAQVKPEQLETITKKIKDFLSAPSEQKKQELRKAISIALAENTNMNMEEVNQFISQWEKEYDQLAKAAKEKLQKIAIKTSKALSSSLLTLFFINTISGITAIIGAISGNKKVGFFKS